MIISGRPKEKRIDSRVLVRFTSLLADLKASLLGWDLSRTMNLLRMRYWR